jgi:hypothetical protein
MSIAPEMLSPIQISMLVDVERQHLIATKKNFIGPLPKPNPRASVEKLVPNLQPKTLYITHYQNLQLYQQLGLHITKIHRVITFKQSTWLKQYIELNTGLRSRAVTEFQQNFFKAMNNQVFGKLMENVRNRRNITLVQNPEKLRKLTSQTTYKSLKVFKSDLVAVERFKTVTTLNKPIYSGFCVLDISKVLMYQFHYGYIKEKYPNDKSQLLFTDTDSLAYIIRTNNIYDDMFADKHLFDFSGYDKTSQYFDESNKKVIGKFSDELKGKPMQEFVGLRAKLYAFKYENKEVKKCKGIAKATVKNNIHFDQYKQCLEQNYTKTASVTSIRSTKHNVYTVNQQKVALSCFDDKRYLLNNIKSLPYGHYKTI